MSAELLPPSAGPSSAEWLPPPWLAREARPQARRVERSAVSTRAVEPLPVLVWLYRTDGSTVVLEGSAAGWTRAAAK